MHHVRLISRQSAALAQYESLLQLVGLISAILALFTSICNVIGIPIPLKQQDS